MPVSPGSQCQLDMLNVFLRKPALHARQVHTLGKSNEVALMQCCTGDCMPVVELTPICTGLCKTALLSEALTSSAGTVPF